MRSGLEALGRQVLAHGGWNLVFAKYFQNVTVICGIADEGYTFMILCRCTDESHATDVNILNGVSVGGIRFSNRIFEWIEIHSDEVNVIPAEVEQLLVVGIRWTGEQSAVD